MDEVLKPEVGVFIEYYADKPVYIFRVKHITDDQFSFEIIKSLDGIASRPGPIMLKSRMWTGEEDKVYRLSEEEMMEHL